MIKLSHLKRNLPIIFLCLLSYGASLATDRVAHADGWKAGVAKTNITPKESLWLAGYGSRDRPSDGVISDLWIKALALEDKEGRQSVLVTMDLEEIPKSISERIKTGLSNLYGFSRAQVVLNVSHTHSSPVLEDFGDIYPLDSVQRKRIKTYTDGFVKKVADLVRSAMSSKEPVKLYSGNGITRFQVNRRNNTESKLNSLAALEGPNDYAVPVIKVVNHRGKLMAIAFGYACHNTVLADYKWSGDYAGFAQEELEKNYPGTIALFFQGCGGDLNPLPRRKVALARQYGQTLSAAVDAVLAEPMRELSAELHYTYKEIDLPLSPPPTLEELLKAQEQFSGYQKRWVTRQIVILEKGGKLPSTYPFPLQIWRVGEQTMMMLGGEPVIEYAVKLKEIFGQDIFVLGYSNDVMAYIPSSSIINEGGYEGASSVMTTYLPSTWDTGIETIILSQMLDLAKEAGVVRHPVR